MDQQSELSRRLETLPGLPSLPAAALRVIELSRDENASLPQVANVISTDPALAARVLRAANSAQFSRGRECQNLRQALVMLGMDTTLKISLVFSIVSALRDDRSDGIDFRALWRRSLLAAVAARSLAEFVPGVDRDNLFLAGLLQDIGMLAIQQLEPGLYVQAREEGRDHDSLCDLERSAIGADHLDVGVWLLRRWDMPEYLPGVIAASHAVDTALHAGEWARTSSCIAVSGLVADVWAADGSGAGLEQLSRCAGSLLGMSPTDVGVLLARVREVVPETESLFSMPLVDEQQMQKVLNEATEMVLRDNLSALKQAGVFVDEAVREGAGTGNQAAGSAQRLLELASDALIPKAGNTVDGAALKNKSA